MKITVLAALLYLSLAQSYTGVFAFSWIAGYCQYETLQHHPACTQSLVSLWDNQSLTIHGLWPDTISSTSYGSFDSSILEKSPKLLDDMQNFWPPYTKNTTSSLFLWDHEWTTHGKDYSNIINKLRPEQFQGTVEQRNSQLQNSFYNDVINFYKRFNLKKLPNKTYTKASFASLFGISENQLSLHCASGNILREVQVCFQILKTGIHVANCAKSSNSCSGESVDLPSWSVKPQSRVFNYPKMTYQTKGYLLTE